MILGVGISAAVAWILLSLWRARRAGWFTKTIGSGERELLGYTPHVCPSDKKDHVFPWLVDESAGHAVRFATTGRQSFTTKCMAFSDRYIVYTRLAKEGTKKGSVTSLKEAMKDCDRILLEEFDRVHAS